MLAKRHSEAVEGFMRLFDEAGYDVNLKMLNANDYDCPEDRDRVFTSVSEKILTFMILNIQHLASTSLLLESVFGT